MPAIPDAIACPYCDPDDNLFMKRMRVRSPDERYPGRPANAIVAVYRCERCGRTRDEAFPAVEIRRPRGRDLT